MTWRRAQSVPRALRCTLPWVLPRTGDRLPHDELISILGSRGIERVYPAHDWRLRRDVTVKVLTPEAAAKPETRLRFEREARAMAGRDNLWTQVRSPRGKWYAQWRVK